MLMNIDVIPVSIPNDKDCNVIGDPFERRD
jgi:hypothetical protein